MVKREEYDFVLAELERVQKLAHVYAIHAAMWKLIAENDLAGAVKEFKLVRSENYSYLFVLTSDKVDLQDIHDWMRSAHNVFVSQYSDQAAYMEQVEKTRKFYEA